MTAADIAARARSAIGQRTIYRNGAGGRHPGAPRPADEQGMCDCSAFCCWVLGLDKRQGKLAPLMKFNGGWLSTDGIISEARRGGLFAVVATPAPGDLVVYGDRRGPDLDGEGQPRHHEGHVGVVVEIRSLPWGLSVVHCSSSNFKHAGDAIQETGAGVFEAHAAIFARPIGVEGGACT